MSTEDLQSEDAEDKQDRSPLPFVGHPASAPEGGAAAPLLQALYPRLALPHGGPDWRVARPGRRSRAVAPYIPKLPRNFVPLPLPDPANGWVGSSLTQPPGISGDHLGRLTIKSLIRHDFLTYRLQ